MCVMLESGYTLSNVPLFSSSSESVCLRRKKKIGDFLTGTKKRILSDRNFTLVPFHCVTIDGPLANPLIGNMFIKLCVI